MPVPRPYEKKDEFIPRCIGVLINEGKPEDQAVAVCNSIWEQEKMTVYEKIMRNKQNEKNV